MGVQARTAEKVIGELASAQWGVATRAQLIEEGVTSAEIEQRLGTGTLLPQHRGVYRVGHRARSVEATYLAGVLACGEGAVLSGRAAGYLLGLLRGAAPAPEVTALKERKIPGVRVRRARRGEPPEVTTWRGVPITTVPRILVDLAASLSFEDLARACHEAGVRHGTTPAQVDAVLEDRPNTPGAEHLRRVLHGDAHVTLSTLERRFLAVLRQAGLPLPETNRRAHGRRVDCRWPAHRLTVELDGYRYHSSRHAWELDRRREREARARGDEFRRYTYDDVVDHPRLMLRELRELLPS